MICKNCGAHFDDNLPKCPYCGEFSYSGAEKEYFDQLEHLKDDLDDLHETVPEMYQQELKKQTKSLKKIFLIIGAVLLVLALLFIGSSMLMDSLYETDPKAQLLFARENYPIADEYYEAKDYEGLLEFYHTSTEENPSASFYNWDHYPFLMCYENYWFFRSAVDGKEIQDLSEDDCIEILYCYISNRECQKGYPMDAADQTLVSSYEDEMEQVIDQMNFSESLKKELNDLLNATEIVPWKEIESLGKKIYKEIN